jgi:protease I
MRKFCCLLSVLIFFSFSSILLAQNKQVLDKARLKDKKIVMIIAKHMFEESEFYIPKEIFERERANVVVASSTLSEATGRLGKKVKPDILINDIKANKFDAIVFIGGFGVSEYFDDHQAHRIAREALESRKILAAICMAPRILANAGVLEGKKATCYPSVRGDLKGKGAIVTGEMVERDGKVITGNGPSAAERFGELIVLALIG